MTHDDQRAGAIAQPADLRIPFRRRLRPEFGPMPPSGDLPRSDRAPRDPRATSSIGLQRIASQRLNCACTACMGSSCRSGTFLTRCGTDWRSWRAPGQSMQAFLLSLVESEARRSTKHRPTGALHDARRWLPTDPAQALDALDDARAERDGQFSCPPSSTPGAA